MKKLVLFTILLFSNQANAFLEKTLAYRNTDNRPPFIEQYESPGKFYLGAGFNWAAYGRLNDSRGFGMSEAFNKGLYTVETYNAYPNQPNFSHSTKNFTHGYVYLGYAPKAGLLKFTRHEIEIGSGGYSKDYQGVGTDNLFTYSSTTYDTLSYEYKQRYIMYNLYLQTDMSQKINYFLGGGIGLSLSSVTFSGTVYTSSSSTTDETEIASSKNAISPMYSVFIGGTYDVSDSIVLQGRIKGMVTQTPKKRISGSSISYTDDKYGSENGVLVSTIGLDISILFGW